MSKKKREIPLFNGKIIETHCHLDYLKSQSPSETISKSHNNGIEKIITISVEPSNLDKVLTIANDHENVYCSQGIHPHEAKQWDKSTHEKILSNLTNNKVVAVGEIGLDYHYNNSPIEKQREVFETQLQIACDNDLPVIIHSRDADDDTISILNNFYSKLKRKGVIHSYTSGPELAKQALQNDFYLGFNGIITFKNAQNVRDIVDLTPIDKILLETDSPFLTPVPYRGTENAPFYLPFVAEKLSELKNTDVEELLATVYQNSTKLFYRLAG